MSEFDYFSIVVTMFLPLPFIGALSYALIL